MKKHMIALLLSIVMTVGSIGVTPVLATETTAEAAVAVEEETVEETTDVSEEADSVEASETTAEETVDVEEGTVDSEETPAESEIAVTDESAEDAAVGEAVEEPEAEPEQDLTESVEEAEEAETIEDDEPEVTEEEVIESEAKEAVLAESDDVVASGKCGDSITWQLDTSGRLVIDGEGDMYKYVSPSEQGEKVPWASYVDTTKMITSVEISEGITSISPYAFYTCYGDYDNVHEVTIPSTVTTIDACAFYGWGGVEELWMPKNLKKIGSYAFAWSSISSIHMEDEIQKIESYAFYHGNLSRIYGYEDSYAEIYAKNNSKEFISIGVDDKPSIISEGKCGDSITWQLDTSGRLVIDGEGDMYKYVSPGEQGEKVPWASYVDTTKMITSVEISEGITSISPYAFYTCYGDYDNVHEVTIPSTVTTIGEYAFYAWGDSRTVYFKGGVPKGELIGLTATGYYPASDPSWTDSARQNLQGTITWVPWEPESENTEKVHSMYPANGDLIADHGQSPFYIVFSEPIGFNKDGFAYLYKAGDPVTLVSKIGIGKTHIETCRITNPLKNTLELMTAGTVLEPGVEYYILVDPDCISFGKYEDNSFIPNGESYKGISEDTEWRFRTSSLDYMHFINPVKKIDKKLYDSLFIPIYAKLIRENDDGTGGTCYGWAYTVGAKLLGFPGISSFGELWTLDENSEYETTDRTILEYIQLAHLYQYKLRKKNLEEKLHNNRYEDIYNAILDHINGTGKKIIVCVYKDGGGAHALYPLEILSDTDDGIVVRVLNANKSYGSLYTELNLTKSNGEITGFQIGQYSKDITYVEIDSGADSTFLGEVAPRDIANMVHSSWHVEHQGLVELNGINDGDDLAKGKEHLYWCDDQQIEINVGAGDKLGFTDGYQDICVAVSEEADVSLNLDGMSATVESLSDTPSEYGISYSEATTSDDIKTTTITSTTSGIMISQKTSEGIVIQASESDDIVIQTDALMIKAATDGDDVLIKTNEDSSVEVLKDTDSNGTFEEQADVEVLSGVEKLIDESMLSGLNNKVYTGNEIKQEIILTNGEISLIEGVDYTVSYKDNKNVGVATITITGIGAYIGTIEKTFEITPKPVSNLMITDIANKTYNGKPQTQAVIVKDGDTTLADGTDYTVSYKNNINAGTASVVIKGEGNYTGEVTKTFTIKKAPNTITAKSFTRTYSTKAQTFSLGVKIKNGIPTYKSNKKSVTVSKAGKVTVKAKFIGKATITITAPASKNYTATTKKITITVNPTKTALSSVTSPSAGKMTVKWKKNAVGTGYQIQYSTSSKFTSPKAVSVTKNSTLTKTIGSLAKGKKYYVRIRTYKTVGKTKFYSAWSAAKTVTIKK